ncbi:ABC transporter substrate-binding protein [Sinorhizobium fredii]|uniref:ABC transporter substrate-binding protein n=1 Tax=Rhizobium fredii TaxID=380 RepID=A0A2A6M6T9_RHIFR|nr:ABC transporter substrate-binding protein [Sinorhizobium fredii]PDT50109.1 ABC transporter substrate-binding protein [Sinorhizobium fredii]
MRFIISTIAAMALTATSVSSAFAQSNPPPVTHPNPTQLLRVIGFAGGFNLPIWAAQRQGYFTEEKLSIHLTYTPNSVYQITNLLVGNFDIAMTAIDNVVAYQEGQNEAPIGPDPDLFAFMGSDNAFLSLVSQEPHKAIEDLRGKTLTVDAMTTGFAFVLREILARNDIAESEVKFERAGGVSSRFRAMIENPEHAATMQMTPFEIQGEEHNFNTLVGAEDALGAHYMGMVAAARRSWASENQTAVEGFIRAYKRGVDFLYEPANRPVVEALLVANTQMSPATAKAAYDVLLDPETGFYRDVRLDTDGIETVLELRSKYGQPQKSLTDPSRYIDDSFRERALSENAR